MCKMHSSVPGSLFQALPGTGDIVIRPTELKMALRPSCSVPLPSSLPGLATLLLLP